MEPPLSMGDNKIRRHRHYSVTNPLYWNLFTTIKFEHVIELHQVAAQMSS